MIRPDGKEGIYSVVELRPSVGIVALSERREIVASLEHRPEGRLEPAGEVALRKRNTLRLHAKRVKCGR